MNFDEYQSHCRETIIPPATMPPSIMWILGVCGEVGELAEKLKKLHRDKNGWMEPGVKESIEKEIGDVLWYLTVLADSLGIKMDDVAHKNILKLLKRYEENKIQGEGDER